MPPPPTAPCVRMRSPMPLQFRLDGKRPDLTKLGALLGMLASQVRVCERVRECVRVWARLLRQAFCVGDRW